MLMKTKLIRNIIILCCLLAFAMFLSQGRFSPDAAVKAREVAENYGPSEQLGKWDYVDRKIYLNEYDKWLSFAVVKRSFLGLWYVQEYFIYNENIPDARISSGTSSSSTYNNGFGSIAAMGYINDAEISRIELEVSDENKLHLVLEPLYIEDNIFFFYYGSKDIGNSKSVGILAYNESNELIYSPGKVD